MVYDQSGHMIDDVRAKGYTGYFVNPGDMGVWPFKNSNNDAQKSRGGKYQGQDVDVTGNKTGYSFVSPKAGLTWAQLKERWQKKKAERAAAKKQPQTPAQPEQQAPVQPAPQANAVPPTQDEIVKGTDATMKAGVPYENKNGEKRVFVPSQNNDPARANIGGGVAKGVANREVAKQAAQAPAYQPSSEKEAQFYARAQMNKAAQQGRANVQPASAQAQSAQSAQPAQPVQAGTRNMGPKSLEQYRQEFYANNAKAQTSPAALVASPEEHEAMGRQFAQQYKAYQR